MPVEMLLRHEVLIWDPPSLPEWELTPSQLFGKMLSQSRGRVKQGLPKMSRKRGFDPNLFCVPAPPNLNDSSLEGAFPPRWMSDLCFAFSPARGTSTLTLQHVPTCWDGKQSIELCVLGQLSLLKSQERRSCMKQMNKGQGTRAGVGEFGPSLRRIFKNYCCVFSPLPISSESSFIWPLINEPRNFVWPAFQWHKKRNFHWFLWRDVVMV